MCEHKYAVYEGILEKYDYCSDCGKKKSEIQAQTLPPWPLIWIWSGLANSGDNSYHKSFEVEGSE